MGVFDHFLEMWEIYQTENINLYETNAMMLDIDKRYERCSRYAGEQSSSPLVIHDNMEWIYHIKLIFVSCLCAKRMTLSVVKDIKTTGRQARRIEPGIYSWETQFLNRWACKPWWDISPEIRCRDLLTIWSLFCDMARCSVWSWFWNE